MKSTRPQTIPRPIHPFPARMAPELALMRLRRLKEGSVVLDPMVGSGTVVRQASDLGHHAIGFDTDPLAILMATVWTRPVRDASIEKLLVQVIEASRSLSPNDTALPWIDGDAETRDFVKYWFATRQRSAIRRLAHVLHHLDDGRADSAARASADVLRLALSRIIITKDRGASLARDVSHSRPHKVAEASDFDVFAAFTRSVAQVRTRLLAEPPAGNTRVRLGDARSMRRVADHSVDAVLTSPPYLNAIDYMRGHRMSLVWLGHTVASLRTIRAEGIGSERSLGIEPQVDHVAQVEAAMCDRSALPPRHAAMVRRYAYDVVRMIGEVARVLKPGGRATFVVGNSCLKENFIRNSRAVERAALLVGLQSSSKVERDLPDRNRYLPMPADSTKPLGQRMRTETILTFTA